MGTYNTLSAAPQPAQDAPPPRASRPLPWGIVAGMLVIYLVWGSTYLAIRVGVETIPPFLMAGVRYSAAGGILFVWLLARGARRPDRREWTSALFLGALLLLGGNGLVTWAEQWIPSSTAALVITSTPLWMAIFDWLFFGGSRPSKRMTAGIVLGFVGVVLLIEAPKEDSSAPWLALAAMCGATMSWTLGSLFSRRTRHVDPPLLTTALQMLCGGGLMLVTGVALGEVNRLDLSAISWPSWFSLAYLTIFGSLLAFTTYMWLLRVARPAIVSTYAYVNPLVAVVVGAGLGGEPVTANLGVATAMIVSAVALVAWRPSPVLTEANRPASDPTPHSLDPTIDPASAECG